MPEYTQEQEAAVQRMAAHAAELPVCELTPGEEALMGRYLDAHGDPSEWTADVAHQYEAEHNALMGETR